MDDQQKHETLNDDTVVNRSNKSHCEEATEGQNTIQKPVELKARLNNLVQTENIPSSTSSNIENDNQGRFSLNESEL